MALGVPDGTALLFLTVYTAIFVTAFEATILAIVWRLRPLLRLVPMLGTLSRDELVDLGKLIADWIQERREIRGKAHVHRLENQRIREVTTQGNVPWVIAKVCRRCSTIVSVHGDANGDPGALLGINVG